MTRIWLILERYGEVYSLVDVVFDRLEACDKLSHLKCNHSNSKVIDESLIIEQLDVRLNIEGEVFDERGRFEELKIEPFNQRVIEYLNNLHGSGGVKFF